MVPLLGLDFFGEVSSGPQIEEGSEGPAADGSFSMAGFYPLGGWIGPGQNRPRGERQGKREGGRPGRGGEEIEDRSGIDRKGTKKKGAKREREGEGELERTKTRKHKGKLTRAQYLKAVLGCS